MSSYAYFQYFHSMARLDNFVSGIPNAIMEPNERGPAFALTGNTDRVEYTQVIVVVVAARVAAGLKTDVKEEANVEF